MTIVVKSLRQESRDRYLTYALSVVSGRALPDVRDGLKPVQRRILFAMLNNLRLKPDGSHKKSAAVIGDVLAKYHPHGDVACYEAMVRMAQDFSFRYPLVDGQGNFGSLDGDGPAAYRYTEVKLMPIAIEVLGEITEDTVEFQDNFDASTKEPVVLPCKIPNLLVNGASGIAVGMATSIPPHNLKDVVKAITAYIDDQEISTAKLSQLIKAPDFPTGCSIMNTRQELTEMYRTGRGAVRMRGDWKIEEEKRGKKYIIITSIPYTVDKSQLVEKIASVIIAKKLPQLVDIRDESTEIVRVVMELASPDIQPDLVMAYLFKNTPMEVNFQVNLTALVPAQGIAMRPELLSLKQMIVHFVDFRTEVVQRRLSYELRNLKDRMHILDGFVIIFDALDEAIQIVRKSTGRADSAEKLQKRFKLSEIQALAIVDLRIYQLSRTNIDEIRTELAAAAKRVAAIEAILKDRKKITAIVKADLEEIATRFGDKRKSALVQDFEEVEINEADYVVQEDVFAIVTKDGWLKRIRQQNAVESTRVREGDSILAAHPLSTIDYVGFFTNHGNFYILKVLDFPSSSGYGNPIQKLLKFKDGEAIISSMPIRAPENKSEVPSSLTFLNEGQDLLLVSSDGVGFALTLEGIFATKRNGKRVIKLRETTTLNAVCVFDNNCAFFTHKGSAVAIKKQEVPLRNQPAIGVSLISVRSDDHIVGAVCYSKAIEIDLILNNGKDKRIKTSEITTGKRGLKGTKIIPRGEIEKIKIL